MSVLVVDVGTSGLRAAVVPGARVLELQTDDAHPFEAAVGSFTLVAPSSLH